MLKCKSCPCVFETESDLELHIAAFGKRHFHKWVKLHKDVEKELEQEHGGADRILKEIANIVLMEKYYPKNAKVVPYYV